MNQVDQQGTKPMMESENIVSPEEALSALMDGELEEFELRRLLARISDRPDLLATWERYNLARAVFQPEPLNFESLRTRDDVMLPDALTSRIMAAIEAEPRPQAATIPVAGSRSGGGLAKLAVAASVAVAVFVGMQTLLDQPQAPMMASVHHEMPDDAVMQVAVDEDAQQRLNDYIRSVTIPARAEPVSGPYNILLESPMLRPVSDLELIQEIDRPALDATESR
ncbi:MAG TPA: sigma-E factor negative regulatory protein [Pseudohongiella sp.]|nr:sigma-E factor negative regulatory protein [Pseudohongiella sp.]